MSRQLDLPSWPAPDWSHVLPSSLQKLRCCQQLHMSQILVFYHTHQLVIANVADVIEPDLYLPK